MVYKIVKAKDREEALNKSGLIIGASVRIVDVRVSYAGEGRYAIMPVIEAADQEEESDSERSTSEVSHS